MDSVSPINSGAGPYEGISEFALPNRARNLATRIIWDLINPCRRRWENAVAKLQAAKNENDNALKTALSQTQELLVSLAQISSEAQSHLRSRGLSFEPKSVPSNLATEYSFKDVESAKKEVVILAEETKRFCAKELPHFWPKGKSARWLIVIASFILFLAVPPRGVGLLIYPVVVFLARIVTAASIKSKYKQLCQNAQDLRCRIKTLEEAPRKLHQTNEEKANRDYENDSANIQNEFVATAESFHHKVKELWNDGAYAVADWDLPTWSNWTPDPSPEFAARIGTFAIGADDLRAKFPKVDFAFSLPALIPFAEGRCLLIEAAGKGRDMAANTLLSVMIRVLANTPAGKARFTLIDPVGLGQNVADFMHLGDCHKDLISGKAWYEPQHIEQQLTLLMEHMEMVIQTCLRREFPSILDYNRKNHEVAQPFRFLVVNDFPVNFTEASTRRLLSIVKNGPRCGVFTFILRDTKEPLPHGFLNEVLEETATRIVLQSHVLTQDNQTKDFDWEWEDADLKNFILSLDGPPPQDLTSAIVKKSGEMAIPAMRLEVPFGKILAAAGLEEHVWWTASSAEELSVPLGPSGAGNMQKLTLGGEQEAHAILVGRTGSGKTNLMHVIVTALALKYPPQEVQLHLVDFKGGIGFKRYAEFRLPHAKVVAIESDREFGMSVLHDLDVEFKKRSEAFRAAHVDNLAAYLSKLKAEKVEAEPLPRILLVVDEFQEFFVDNDDMAQQAKMIFERLARQGRSYGIHFLLATQSLSGSAQLPASIMGQIKVRIALPCSEADSRLILADDNKAARSLSVPGEAIYNSWGGLVEGNRRFQVARFSEDDLTKYLTAISGSASDSHVPIIFEGDELSHLEECLPLKELLLTQDWPQSRKNVDIFLGEPVAILPPVAARLRRQSGGNLIILTREESEGVGLCVSTILNILTQQHPDNAQVYIADFTTADSEWAEHAEEIARNFPGQISVVRRQREVTSTLATIAEKVQSRSENVSGQGSIYLILQGMHRIKSLREDTDEEDGNNSVELLNTILRDGPEVGVHVVAWADTWGNITRGLDRRSIREFGLRVAAVMDSGDSMNFLDSLAASKISKLHRAVLYDVDRPGQLVTFRPYAMPSLTWLKEVGGRLRARTEKPNVLRPRPSV